MKIKRKQGRMGDNSIPEDEGELFTCKDCGSHILYVEHTCSFTTCFTESLECECGEQEDGLAAFYRYHLTSYYREWGILEDDHHWNYDDHDTEEGDKEEDEYEAYCQKCIDTSSEQDWEVEEEEIVEDDDEFFVNCGGCNREIEFGWSHPDRGGRIWPSECTDFNPWKSWPEPRYRENWTRRGWIKPV